MSVIPNMVSRGGKLVRVVIKKRGGDTQEKRAERIAQSSFSVKAFAMRWRGRWHLYLVDNLRPVYVKPAPTKEAAEMWLIHREHARG